MVHFVDDILTFQMGYVVINSIVYIGRDIDVHHTQWITNTGWNDTTILDCDLALAETRRNLHAHGMSVCL